MSWIRKGPAPKQKAHVCRTPVLFFWRRVGSLWQCDECKYVWMVDIYRDSSCRYRYLKLVDSRGLPILKVRKNED